MGRTAANIALKLVIAVVVTVALGLLYFLLVLGAAFPDALDQAVRLTLGFVDVGILAWLGLLIVGGVRRRGLGWGFGGGMLAALVGALVNLVWIAIISTIQGGADIFAIALGVQAGVFFLIGALVATLVVRRLLPISP